MDGMSKSRGVADLRRAGHRGGGVSDPTDRGRAPVPVDRRDVPQGAPGRPRAGHGDGGGGRGDAARASARSLGVDAGPSEDGAFWTAFLRSLVKRGPARAVQAGDLGRARGAQEGDREVLGGELAAVPGALHAEPAGHDPALGAREPVAAIVRTIFAQPDRGHGHGAAAQGGRRAARRASPRPPRCSRRPPRTSWPTGPSRSSTAASCTARTRWSG